MRTSHLVIAYASLLLLVACGNETGNNAEPDAGTTLDTNTNDVSTSDLGQSEPETVDEEAELSWPNHHPHALAAAASLSMGIGLH